MLFREPAIILCNMNIKGKIHSTESFGAADGPGIRFVIFMQGCRMRCKYCHNPDTWDLNGGYEMTSEELLNKAVRYKGYWKKNGGITVSGGEPLLQIDFLIELFKMAKEMGIHTAIDTAGNPFTKENSFFTKFIELMKYTDLVIADIKEINSERHKNLTGFENENILEMLRFLDSINKPVWIRHVLVPQYSDFDEDLDDLGAFVRRLKNIERIEVLPYHTLGKFKWEELKIPYQLENILPPSENRIQNAERRIHGN